MAQKNPTQDETDLSKVGDQKSGPAYKLYRKAIRLFLAGKPQEAEPLYAEVLRLNRQEFGDRHPWTATSLNNYASVIQFLGRVSEAEPLFAEALRLHRQVLGERHSDTLIGLHNYAYVLHLLGRNGEAEIGSRVIVLFTDDQLPKEALDGVTGLQDENVQLGKRELFIFYPNGHADTRLRLPSMKAGSARNINTVTKITEMARAPN